MKHSHLPGLVVRLFGYPEIKLDGASVHLERHKAIALFAYVAVTGERLGRDTLAALFWPNCEGAEANAYLRRTLWELRKALGKDCLDIDRQTVAMPRGDEAWVDVVHFQELMASSRAAHESDGRFRFLREAAALYCGDFLAGFSLRDSPDFDEWQSLQAGALRRQLGEALATLAEDQRDRGDYDTAIETARRWLALDPLDEEPQRALMRLYGDNGQRVAAVRQYEACVAILRSELDALPEAETTALYEALREGKVGRPRQARRLVPRPAPSLPTDSLPFVGREAELAEIGRLLVDPGCHLLTLVGPGGVGKTRLAIQAARAYAGSFADGVAYVPLDAQPDAEGLVAAVAGHFRSVVRSDGRGKRSPAEARRQLVAGLRRRAVLLVLDNAEHLISAVADLLAELLSAAPRVKLLVTSRERLRLPEEWVLELAGLPYPEPGQADNLAEYPAVQLFVRAARRVRVGLSLEPEDWSAIGCICGLLEGLPLGIELAATWVRVLSCTEIAAEIEGGQGLLASPEWGVPERHRSLGAVCEQSWRLLGPQERDLLARLSVFAAGFTREAAARVSGASLVELAGLVDKSLVRREGSGRYALHSILRQHAAEKLSLSTEVEQDARARHAAYYLDWLAALGEGLRGPEQRTVLAKLAGETANLRLAWECVLARGEWERVRRALPHWALAIEMGTHRAEGAEFTRSAAEIVRAAIRREGPSESLNAILALLLALRRFLAISLEPELPPGPLAEESLALARSLPDCAEKAIVYMLSVVRLDYPTPAGAQSMAQECLAVFQALGDPWGVAMAQLVTGDVACFTSGDLGTAQAAYRSSRAAFRALGNRWGEALCLFGLTTIAHRQERYAEAVELGQECVAVYQELGNPWRIIDALVLVSTAASETGDTETARAYLERAAALYHQLGNDEGAERVLEALRGLEET